MVHLGMQGTFLKKKHMVYLGMQGIFHCGENISREGQAGKQAERREGERVFTSY